MELLDEGWLTTPSPSGISHYDSRETKTGLRVHRVRFTCVNTPHLPTLPPHQTAQCSSIIYDVREASNKDTPSWLQKLLSFRYQKPNQIPIEGTVSNPEFEPNQISATRNQSRMRTGQASILVKVIKMSKYWRKTSKNKGSGVNLGCPCQGQYDYLLVRAI